MALDGIVGTTRIVPLGARRDYLHVAVFLADGRVLDDRVFRLAGFSGQEAVSTPFEFQLELRADTLDPDGQPIAFSDIIGRPVTFAVRRPPAGDEPAPLTPFEQLLAGGSQADFSIFNGLATGFSMAEPGVYSLSVKAALWKLNLANGYGIHAQRNVRDTIAALLDRHHILYDMSALQGEENLAVGRIQDWMQAGESDFAFLQRLMAKAHLYYYFVHRPAGHTVVFANAPNYREVFADGRRLRYTHTGAEQLGLNEDDVVAQYSYQESLTSSAVNGIFTRQENAWENDPVAQFTSYQAARPEGQGVLPFHQYKIYQYGCDQGEVARFTGATASALASAATQLSGSSRCDRFRTGYRFALGGPMGPESNPNPVRPSLEGRRFVITQVQHEATLDGGYKNTFQATEDTGLITPFSIDDTHQGSILGKVVAIHDDGAHSSRWEYLYKTDFEPAQQTCEDRASGSVLNAKGVYVQFSTSDGPGAPVFVKLAPHMQTVPEVGVTVLVSRANDESELPEIQSIIHANGSKVVMPSGWTANTQVGNGFSTSYGDSKSVRFGRCSNVGPGDVDAAVQKIEDAYKTGQYKEVSFSQGGSFSYSTAEAGRNGMLSNSESHGNTYSRQAAGETKNWSDVDFSYSESIVGTTESHSTVRQDSLSYQTIEGRSYSESTIGSSEDRRVVTGDSVSRSATRGRNTSYSTVDGDSYSESVTGNVESHATTNGASRNYQTSNGDTYAASVTNGDATSVSTVTGTSDSRSTVTMQKQSNTAAQSQSTNIIGTSDSTNLTGASSGLNLTGSSSNVNVLGQSSDVSVTGIRQSLNLTGATNDVSIAGVNSNISIAGVGIEVSLRGGVLEYNNKASKVETPTLLIIVL